MNGLNTLPNLTFGEDIAIYNKICHDTCMQYISNIFYMCKICGLPDHELLLVPEEISGAVLEITCTDCMDWVNDTIIPYTQNKLLTACGGDLRYVYLLAETDEVEREMMI